MSLDSHKASHGAISIDHSTSRHTTIGHDEGQRHHKGNHIAQDIDEEVYARRPDQKSASLVYGLRPTGYLPPKGKTRTPTATQNLLLALGQEAAEDRHHGVAGGALVESDRC
jgi:hypothetical protein